MPSGELTDDVFNDLGLSDEEDVPAFEVEQEEQQEEAAPEEYEEAALTEIDEEGSEVERRLTLAQFYKQLTRGGLFNGNSREARQVDEEVRDFARSRMNALVGIGGSFLSKGSAAPFTDEQIEALRQIADRLLEQQGGAPAIRRMEPPTVAKRPTITPPRSAIVQRQASVTKPQVRTSARPTPAKASPAKKPKTQGKDDLSQFPLDTPFEENGRIFKVTISPHPDENGKAKRVKMDVTPQVRPPNAIPTPRREHMELVSAQHAASVRRAQEKDGLQRHIGGIVMSSD